MSKWKSTRTPPQERGAIWIRREIAGDEMGEWDGEHYTNYGSSADQEGLGIEWYSDVTHWADIDPPPFDYQETT